MAEVLLHHCQPLSTQHGRLVPLLPHHLPLAARGLHQLCQKRHILRHLLVLPSCRAALLSPPLSLELGVSLLLSLPSLPPVAAHSSEQLGVVHDVLE